MSKSNLVPHVPATAEIADLLESCIETGAVGSTAANGTRSAFGGGSARPKRMRSSSEIVVPADSHGMTPVQLPLFDDWGD
jgi:hypothetical protein